MKLKDFDISILSDRDYVIYRKSMAIRKDCTQWSVMRTYASCVQNPLLEDLLINESNIMFHTLDHFNTEQTDEL